jgi:N-acetylglucosamine-6-phosphate deacetylase
MPQQACSLLDDASIPGCKFARRNSSARMSDPPRLLGSSGTVIAWHYSTREPVELTWHEGSITQMRLAKTKPDPNLWVAPALVDIQVNGYAGIDFQRDDVESCGLMQAAEHLRVAGCLRFLLTLVTDDWPVLVARLKRLRKLRSEIPTLQRAIAGWHIEGPFLSSEPGFHGAHDPDRMLNPSVHAVHELRDAAGGDPLLLTLAAERPGSIEAIRVASSLGIRVFLGHTNATMNQITDAIAAGATGFTHLGNACPQTLDRHDNIIWRVLDTPGLIASLICDSIHVSPPLFRIVDRVLGRARVLYTTDAMAAAGAPPGRYSIGKLDLEVGTDGIVRQPGRSNFAGSSIRPIDGIIRASQMLRSPWQDVWDSFSTRPATAIGIPSGIELNGPSHFCLIRVENEIPVIAATSS